ncbi:FtsJ-domain-containing protein [Lipomyces japonicus]|uniref:FtsJ-domain-containing protein n=1 Tax=Lipomyces japonicus TaxID=56871 RepID=UPI0034CE3716
MNMRKLLMNRSIHGEILLTVSNNLLTSIARRTGFLSVAIAHQVSQASTASSKRWNQRQKVDLYRKEAEVKGLRSRAAFKLLEIDMAYKIFKAGQTVIDLGFAPGSWTQVAVDRTIPGRVIGIDILPCSPPQGASAIQGNFLYPQTHEMVKEYLSDSRRGRSINRTDVGYIDPERHDDDKIVVANGNLKISESAAAGMVDVVLSDMSDPWYPNLLFWSRTLSEPYYRMANTSGNAYRDHAMSMDLCNSALAFALDTLSHGGVFICKFFAGSEDAALEKRLRKSFTKVKREKPAASRRESKEQYFVAIGRKKSITKHNLYGDLYDVR